jgi:hypothetical protein
VEPQVGDRGESLFFARTGVLEADLAQSFPGENHLDARITASVGKSAALESHHLVVVGAFGVVPTKHGDGEGAARSRAEIFL